MTPCDPLQEQTTVPPQLHTFQNFLSPILDPAISPGFSFPLDFNVNEEFRPLGFVRALESDFLGRNWHEEWWDMDGEVGF